MVPISAYRKAQGWADGRVFYQVAVHLGDSTGTTARLYQWPQPGLRTAQRPTTHTSSDAMPTPPPRRPSSQ
ncbi:hypothetical protein [Streptomyces sp. NPDC093984]|uniref:hypothetical protein n=1 Tax=Streptomyces sp. NPDC093984 TaxID=3366052 RepID=UPI0037F4734E